MRKKYKCPYCKKILERESKKQWIKSYCVLKDGYIRLQIIREE